VSPALTWLLYPAEIAYGELAEATPL